MILRRIVAKAVILLIIFNYLFAGCNQTAIGSFSFYNSILPGRERLPFGENPSRSYNLTLNNTDAMFASLRLAAKEKQADEYRVFIIGDSSVWGSLQSNADTLSGQLNSLNLKHCDGKQVIFYNLGYPTLSIMKDLLIMDRALIFQPDQIIWLVTLESFPRENQTNSDLLRNNSYLINKVLRQYGLQASYQFGEPGYFNLTFLMQKRNLADIARLQAYGIMWAATGIDQDLNAPYTPAMRDFEADETFHGRGQRVLENELSLGVLEKTVKSISVPIILINEPILISRGKNSDIRYNYYYPRWAYDQYRLLIKNTMIELNNPFYDLYDLVPEQMFTNSAIHLNRDGETMLANEISSILSKNLCLEK